ncbi:Putative metallo-hydrolase YycJ [BD1-7 clade bacterium]|uniref:Metallo-hydrolase YycJ n=1 Tax=BD1-7 clade bacterium TaxID=2029982 RepID=A0A5S9QIF7_9GAMM|nr:Putative metallo-hydrolase YycJ [BD1-7 clade bacterium]CAA0117757.1 Putative metallo-hydrolase YycJ [BD1-7 clade bacterium]
MTFYPELVAVNPEIADTENPHKLLFCCLGSGSKGNATLVKYADTTVMIDCGFTYKHTIAQLEAFDIDPQSLDAVLVTHEHSDHIKGVRTLSRKLNIPVYLTHGTARSDKIKGAPELQYLVPDVALRIKDIEIIPVTVPHDAHEPCQFLLRAQGRQLGVVTDLGSISRHVQHMFDGCDALVLEANHDVQMLRTGPYPPSLKRRVESDWGHLSNEQAVAFLDALPILPSRLVLAHISEKNNCLSVVKNTFQRFESRIPTVVYACQNKGFDWLEV